MLSRHVRESVVAVTEDPRLAAQTDLLALLLQGRPEQVTDLLLGSQSSEVRAEAAHIADALASLALALPSGTTDPTTADPLRARILATLAGQRAPRTAILVIDMLNDHLTPGGPLEVARARDIVPALAARLDAARAARVPVVYVCDRHDPDYPEFELWPTHNVAGSKGAEVWPALSPAPGDRVVPKPTYSGFTSSTLDAVLDELAVDTLVLTGCLTEIGIAVTAMDALQRGYAVEVPADSQAGSGHLAEATTMATLSMLLPFAPARKARLAAVDALLAAVPPT